LPLKALALGLSLVVLPTAVFAWDGVDEQTGGAVEIEKGNLVRSGETIEIYDSNAGEYRDVEVQDVQRYGGSVEVEVYDSETGETRTLEMDD
jgi:hypothetical protein